MSKEFAAHDIRHLLTMLDCLHTEELITESTYELMERKARRALEYLVEPEDQDESV